MEGDHPNLQAVENFLDAFKIGVRIGQTERVDNEKVQNAYMAAHMDNKAGIGFTIAVFDAGENRGLCKVLVECVGTKDDAERFGKLIAKVIEP